MESISVVEYLYCMHTALCDDIGRDRVYAEHWDNVIRAVHTYEIARIRRGREADHYADRG